MSVLRLTGLTLVLAVATSACVAEVDTEPDPSEEKGWESSPYAIGWVGPQVPIAPLYDDVDLTRRRPYGIGSGVAVLVIGQSAFVAQPEACAGLPVAPIRVEVLSGSLEGETAWMEGSMLGYLWPMYGVISGREVPTAWHSGRTSSRDYYVVGTDRELLRGVPVEEPSAPYDQQMRWFRPDRPTTLATCKTAGRACRILCSGGNASVVPKR